jgi:hypothetical protein
VTEDMAEPEDAALLRALGQVEPPVPGVLETAREALWSAVAGEMLPDGEASQAGRHRAGGTARSQPDIRHHRTEPES